MLGTLILPLFLILFELCIIVSRHHNIIFLLTTFPCIHFYSVAYDEDNETLTQGKHIQLFMEHLHDTDPVKHLPQQYIMASRVSILLRGLGHAVHQSRSVAKAWRPIAEKVLREEGV